MRSIVIAFVSLLLFSCEKSNVESEFKGVGKFTSIENEAHKVIAKFIYNSDGTLKESWQHCDFYMGDSKAEYKYVYDSDGFLIGKEGFEPGNMFMSSTRGAMDKNVSVVYAYTADKKLSAITSAFDYNEFSNINYSRVIAFEYPNDTTVLEKTMSEYENRVISEREYKYDSKGNIYQIADYTIDENDTRKLLSVDEMKYDNMNASFQFEPTPCSKNNPIEKKTTAYRYESGNRSVAYTSIFKYEYTYYENDFPLMEKEIWPNEVMKIRYFTY